MAVMLYLVTKGKEKSYLLELANGCPVTLGSAKFAAQSILIFFDSTITEFESTCDELESREFSFSQLSL